MLDADDDSPVPCLEIWRYAGEDGQYVALMRNPEFDAASFRQAGYPDNAEIEKRVRIRVVFDGEVKVTDMRTGDAYGSATQTETDLEPWSPVILKLEE